jgi:Arc/MetJ family transcription regulator
MLAMYLGYVHCGCWRRPVSVTQIDLDDEALAEAMRLMGATTKKETVNAALRDYVARIKRVEAAEKLAARGSRGEFEQAAAAHDAEKRARREAFE